MVNQHFFQPLLPGFSSHLNIPVAFFLKNIEGRTEKKSVKLRSDVSKISWEVKLDGKKLSDGWEDFALAHDLRIGDIVIFRHEKDMAFHVTILGPSCCEILYQSCLNEQNKLEMIERNPKRETESSSLDPSCFTSIVTPSSLKEDRMHLPNSFGRENGIDTRCGEIVLMDEKGRSWTLALKLKKPCGTVYIHGGWRSFCVANGLRAGDFFTFKLSRKGGTLVLRLSHAESEEADEIVSVSTESDEEECSKADEIVSLSTESDIVKESNKDEKSFNKRKASSSASQNLNKVKRTKSSSLDSSCFVVHVAPYTLRYDELNFPLRFGRENGLDKRCGDIVLMNQEGRSWTFALKQRKSRGTAYISRGWRSFCRANGLKAGDSFTFKLIQRGRTLVLRMSSRESEEEEECSEVESLSSYSDCDNESNQEEKSCKKSRSRWNPSSLPSQNQFVTLTLTPYNIKKCLLFLPAPFTRINGINEETKMSLLDDHGVKWSTRLRSENRRLKMVGGWKDFFRASKVETGESVVLKLIWEEDSSCVLMFCSKVKSET